MASHVRPESLGILFGVFIGYPVIKGFPIKFAFSSTITLELLDTLGESILFVYIIYTIATETIPRMRMRGSFLIRIRITVKYTINRIVENALSFGSWYFVGQNSRHLV